jgi:hypothetical protein
VSAVIQLAAQQCAVHADYQGLEENSRGRYLKLSEKRANRPRSTVIVPSSGLKWFTKVVLHYIDSTDSRLSWSFGRGTYARIVNCSSWL